MLGVGGSHNLGVVVDHQEVGVVGQPADGNTLIQFIISVGKEV